MDKLRVLLADTSVTSRKILADAVENTSLGMVVHTAPNSSIALEWLNQCEIDVVIVSAAMAVQDGLELLAKIKAVQDDIEIIILSNGSPESAEVTIKALEQGAFDFILKTEESDAKAAVEKIKSQMDVLFAQIKVKKYSMPEDKSVVVPNEIKLQKRLFGKPELVLIASSTGGPAALEILLKELPGNFPVPILIVQHMPADFTSIFANNLNKLSELDISEAREGGTAGSGQAVIAAGGMHMTVKGSSARSVTVALDKSPYVNGVRPSADILFSSAARVFEGRSILAVILTGMGNDGMRGVYELKSRCSCYCITQSESTSVVYGMPRCVAEMGMSDESADIRDIAARICRLAL